MKPVQALTPLHVLVLDRDRSRRRRVVAALASQADGALTLTPLAEPEPTPAGRRAAPDVAILSMGPREDTLARAAELRRALPGVPIIALGGEPEPNTQALVEAGVQDHVPGPCAHCPNRTRLVPSVRWAVERARLLRRIEVLSEQSSFRALHDPLTGLPNRKLFCDRLSQALARSGRRREGFAVMFVDLDRFKRVNDSLGHAGGDRLLVEVARRLRSALRASDTCARWGGDEFALLLSGIRNKSAAARAASKLLRALEPPVPIDGQDVHPGASIGICLHPQDGSDEATLIRHADLAMYRAKATRRGGYRFFREDLDVHPLLAAAW